MWWSCSSAIWPGFLIPEALFVVLMIFAMLHVMRNGKMMCECAGEKEMVDLRKDIDHLRVEMDTLRKFMREGKP